MRKVFIAGCGRSGTTLALRMMRCFEGHTVLKESPFTAFEGIETDAPAVFIKRDASAYMLLHEMPTDVGLIYVVRHPHDVLTSYHRSQKDRSRYYIRPRRWLEEWRAYQKLDRHHLVLRFEDMLSNPDGVQEQIAKEFGLKIRSLFSQGERLHPTKAGRSQYDAPAQAYLNELPAAVRREIDAFCEAFGYTPNDSRPRAPSPRNERPGAEAGCG